MAKGLAVFKKHVRSILTDRCLNCHGGEKTKAKFNLTTRQGLLRGGNTGPGIVPGNADKSWLYKLITHAEEPPMPHKADKLPDEAIARIADWINLKAPYDSPLIAPAGQPSKGHETITEKDRNFWSFRPLQRPLPPQVKAQTWCRTPVDRFILAKLEAKRLKPNPVADRRTLIRRVYFDLIGLPPTPQQVNAFVADPNPDAYDKLIDQLLESPHYGERWGRHWLDVSRFAESHGFEQDYDRPYAYHFRDFVIQALNADMPYDTFVKWQLAGDEIAPDDPLAMMATGFLGAGVFPTQITANEVERTRYDALDDMASTMGTAMLGLTIGCARCHDHKYDPIASTDYYRLISTFATTVRSNIKLDFHPEIYQKAKADFDREQAPLVAALAEFERTVLPDRFQQWLNVATAAAKQEPAWVALDWVDYDSAGGATWTELPDGSLLAGGANAKQDTYTFVAHTDMTGLTSVRLEALAHPSLAKNGPGRSKSGNFLLTSFHVKAEPLNGKDKPVEMPLVHPRATFEQKDLPIKATTDGNKRSGWAIDPQLGKNHAAGYDFEKPIGFNGGTKLTFTLEFQGKPEHNIGRLRLSVSTSTQPVDLTAEATLQSQAEIQTILKAGQDHLTDAQRAALIKWYAKSDPAWQALNQKVKDHLKNEPTPDLTDVMVCSEGFTPIRHHTQGADFFKETYFLVRGDSDQKRERVTPSFLRVLMKGEQQEKRWQVPPPKGARTSFRRTGLANWITDTEYGAGHLLARVIVNRLWHHHFGRGIVATPNDFGFQGQRPTHPELLDWLATEFMRNDWRQKYLHKLIMTSAVYQQSDAFHPGASATDPQNLYLWRRTPRRIEAELIRDSLLTVCGRLDQRMFGPGTLSEDSNRRSIYFTIKRSKLIPSMQLFDAPQALGSIGSRSSTTIAPQALMFMNNSRVRAYARQFAGQLESLAAKSLPDAVERAYQMALARRPDEAERQASIRFIKSQTASYAKEKKDNSQALAMTDFCQTLFSLNEFVFVE